jgi:hypothetical protein
MMLNLEDLGPRDYGQWFHAETGANIRMVSEIIEQPHNYVKSGGRTG